jgi:hypothetical protein
MRSTGFEDGKIAGAELFQQRQRWDRLPHDVQIELGLRVASLDRPLKPERGRSKVLYDARAKLITNTQVQLRHR